MIIVKLMGGLGNQMFQYALGRHLANKNRTSLKLDLTTLLDKKPNSNFTCREYELGIFHIRAEFVSQKEIGVFFQTLKSSRLKDRLRQRAFPRHYIGERHFHFDARVLQAPNNTYLEGYWQSEKYFKESEKEIRNDFSFTFSPPADAAGLAQQIEHRDSVGVHVRRGDYISNPVTQRTHGVCSLDYFANATSIFLKRIRQPHFFVFSDDPAWCSENFRQLGIPYTIAAEEYCGHNSECDLYLMSRCKHFIISNSTYGWWAAWLNQNPGKTVVAPRHWFANEAINVNDLYLVNTITI